MLRKVRDDGTWRQGFIVPLPLDYLNFYHCNMWRIKRKQINKSLSPSTIDECPQILCIRRTPCAHVSTLRGKSKPSQPYNRRHALVLTSLISS